MNRIFALFLALSMVLILTACGGSTESSAEVSSAEASVSASTSASASVSDPEPEIEPDPADASVDPFDSAEGSMSLPGDLSAPPSDAPSDAPDEVMHDLNGDGELLIYGLFPSADDVWYQQETAAAEKAIQAAGGSMVTVEIQSDPKKELAAVCDAIDHHADGILACIPDRSVSREIADLCEDAGIPIVACDNKLLDAEDALLVPWVGTSDEAAGEAAAQWVCDYLTETELDLDDSVALLMLTTPDLSASAPRMDTFTDLLKEHFFEIPEMGRMVVCEADGTIEGGTAAAAAAIEDHPEFSGWIVVSDLEENVIGAVRALETAGLDGRSACVGMGGYLAKDEFEAGTCFAAAPFFSADQVAQDSVDTLFQLVDGNDVMMETTAIPPMVTRENYQDYLN